MVGAYSTFPLTLYTTKTSYEETLILTGCMLITHWLYTSFVHSFIDLYIGLACTTEMPYPVERPVVIDSSFENNLESQPVIPPANHNKRTAHLKSKYPPTIELTRVNVSGFPPSLASDRYGWDKPTLKTQAKRATRSLPFPLQPTRFASQKSETPIEVSKRSSRSRPSPHFTPPNSPDRFVPSRRSPDSSVKSFHLGRNTEELSDTERLLRENSASIDPFREPSQNHVRIQNNSSEESHRSARLHHRNSRGVQSNEGQLLPANGSAPGISDGQGGIFSSGTNAPLFSAKFFDTETVLYSDERFQNRVAAALDIDRTSRILRTSQSPEPRRDIGSGSAEHHEYHYRSEGLRTRWKDGKWVTNESR